MPTFFVKELSKTIVIMGDDAGHILRSLRLKIGEQIIIADGKGMTSVGIITQCNKDTVVLDCSPAMICESEPNCKVTLYQAMPKGEKAEIIIQKAVELGVCEVVFFLSSRCISRPDNKDFAKKLLRYNKISLEAAKQCGRGLIPEIRGLLSFDQAVNETNSFEHSLIFYEQSQTPLKQLFPENTKSLAMIIGSEGGFSGQETQKFIQSGSLSASLGRRILRCETAPLCALSAIMYHTGEF